MSIPLTPEQERQMFRRLNRFMVLLFRMGFSRLLNNGPAAWGRYLVIIHTGRKSGQRRRTPVNFAREGDSLYCVAGFGGVSDWYKNLLQTPQCEVWLPEGACRALAAEEHEDRLRRIRAVLVASGFAAQALGGIDPRTVTDEALDKATADYKLLRLTPGAALPSYVDLAWVAPAGLVALGVLLTRLRRRR